MNISKIKSSAVDVNEPISGTKFSFIKRVKRALFFQSGFCLDSEPASSMFHKFPNLKQEAVVYLVITLSKLSLAKKRKRFYNTVKCVVVPLVPKSLRKNDFFHRLTRMYVFAFKNSLLTAVCLYKKEDCLVSTFPGCGV